MGNNNMCISNCLSAFIKLKNYIQIVNLITYLPTYQLPIVFYFK